MKKISIMALFSLLSLFSCKGYDNLSVEAFRQKLSDDGTVQLLDVRTPAEYAEGRIPGALNIDWKADGFVAAAQATLDPNRPVHEYFDTLKAIHAAGIDAEPCASLRAALVRVDPSLADAEAPSAARPPRPAAPPSALVAGSLFLAGEALVELGAYPWAAGRIDPSEALVREGPGL